MQVISLKTNKIENPLGYQFDNIVLSYEVVESKRQTQQSAHIEIATDFIIMTVQY